MKARFRVKYSPSGWYIASTLNHEARMLLNGNRTFIFNSESFKKWDGTDKERILWA